MCMYQLRILWAVLDISNRDLQNFKYQYHDLVSNLLLLLLLLLSGKSFTALVYGNGWVAKRG